MPRDPDAKSHSQRQAEKAEAARLAKIRGPLESDTFKRVPKFSKGIREGFKPLTAAQQKVVDKEIADRRFVAVKNQQGGVIGYQESARGTLQKVDTGPRLSKGIETGRKTKFVEAGPSPRAKAATKAAAKPKSVTPTKTDTAKQGEGTIIREPTPPTPKDAPDVVTRPPGAGTGTGPGTGGGEGGVKQPKRGVRRVRTGGGRRRSLSGRGGGGGARRVSGSKSQGKPGESVRVAGTTQNVNPTLGVS